MTKSKSIILTLFVMLLWGSLYPMVKLSYSAYGIKTVGDTLLFAGIRFAICGLIISLFSLIRDKSAVNAAKPQMLPILASGLFAIILHYGFVYIGLMLTDSSKTSIIKQIGTLLYVCFSFVFFKEDKPTVTKTAGALLGFFGIIAINWGSSVSGFNIGDLLIIASSFCTVFSNVISKKALASVKPVVLIGISQLFGGVILLIVGVALGGRMHFDIYKWYIFAYICAASILGYIVWFAVVKKGELSKLFVIKFAEPVFACVFSAMLLRENIMRLQYLLAFALIAVGIFLANLRNVKEPVN